MIGIKLADIQRRYGTDFRYGSLLLRYVAPLLWAGLPRALKPRPGRLRPGLLIFPDRGRQVKILWHGNLWALGLKSLVGLLRAFIVIEP